MTRVRHLAAWAGVVVALTIAAGIGVTSAASAGSMAPSKQDRAFMAATHQSNLAEIKAGQIAGQKATSGVIRRLGLEFVADHSRLDNDVRALAEQLGVSLPGLLSPTQQAQLAAVSAKSGAAFDSAWVQSRLAGHREALAAGSTELARGSDARVAALAQKAAPVVQMHLRALEQAAGSGSPSGINAGTGGQAARLPVGTVPVGWTLLGLAAALTTLSAVLFGPRRTA
jgi:putative membrane protein